MVIFYVRGKTVFQGILLSWDFYESASQESVLLTFFSSLYFREEQFSFTTLATVTGPYVPKNKLLGSTTKGEAPYFGRTLVMVGQKL